MVGTSIRAGVGFALACVAGAAGGFGSQGHQTVGAMADTLIVGTHAEREVKKILTGSETLSTMATWADCAKGGSYCNAPLTAEMTAYAHANPKHHSYHYADVPFQHVGYEGSPVGIGPDDIVHVLQECVDVLRDPQAASPHHFTRRQALLLIDHLVGDIHQPLHVGTAYLDANDQFVVPASQADLDAGRALETEGDNLLLHGAKNMHAYWDSDLVAIGMRHEGATTPSEYAARLIARYQEPALTTGAPSTWPVQWANESLVLAKRLHENMTPTGEFEEQDWGKQHLAWHVEWSQPYAQAAAESGEQIVAQAGYRLAQLLKTIWP